MSILGSDVRNAVLLSQAAYKNSDGLSDFLRTSNGAEWQALGSDPVVSGPFQGQQLPKPASMPFFVFWDSYFGEWPGDSNFLFDNENAQAFVARNEIDNSVAIAFRGSSLSDGLDDFFVDLKAGTIASFQHEYQKLYYLIESLNQYISDNHITKVLVTGHSLGAVLAEWFMNDHPSASGVEYVGVTFGSPSDRALNGVTDPRLINFGHSEDPIVNISLGVTSTPSDVAVELSYMNSGITGLSEHDRLVYKSTAEAIASSAEFGAFTTNPSSYRVVIGSNEVNVNDLLQGGGSLGFLLGRAGKDQLIGAFGNDLLDGGSENDRLTGGAGNDILDGGSGNDTAIFALSYEHYNISFSTFQVIVAAIFQVPFVYEGTDTLTNIENFEFAGESYSREKLIALLTPSTGTPGGTGDQSGVSNGGYTGGGSGATTNGADVITGDINSTFVIGTAGQALSSAIETAGDKDYVKAHFVQGDTYRIVMQGAANHGYAELQDSFFRIRDGQNSILSSPSDQAGGDQLDYTANYTGWHFISIGAGGTNYATLTGGYSLAVTLLSALAVNHAPVANVDDLGVRYGDVITGNVLINDTDADHNVLTVDFLSSFHTAQSGTVDLLPNGAFQYIAPSSGPGAAQDSFTYVVRDGAGGSATGTVHLNFSQPGGGALFTIGDDYSTVPTGGGIYHALAGNDVAFGSTYSDVIYGEDGDDFLHGLDGNDLLYGGNGDDGFVGGAGDDWIVPGSGRDLVWGDGVSTDFGGFDTVDYSDATGAITIDMQQGTVVGGGINDLISGIDSIVGSGFSDYVHVYADAARVYGSGGGDTIVGWTGEDEFHGGAGNDELQGYGANDRLYGDDGNDTLYGDTGNDVLDGGLGDDGVFGEDGDDYLIASAGADWLRGLDGTDTIDFSQATAGLTGGGAQITVAGWGVTTIDGVEIFIGSIHDDNFDLNAPYQEARLGAGNDRLVATGLAAIYGEDGNDQVFASSGVGRVYGGAGDDDLRTFQANNEFYGNDGNDKLFGGSGINLLYGGDGDDQIFGAGTGNTLFGDAGADQLFGDSGADYLEGGAGADILHGYGGIDSLNGGGDGDTIFGEDGNDSLYGGAGGDRLDGGAGDDGVFGEDGDDTLVASAGTDWLRGLDGIDTIDFSQATAGLTGGGAQITVAAWGVTTIDGVEIFIGSTHDDNFDLNAPYQEARLGAGNDRLTATGLATVHGENGNDQIFALGGVGQVYGGAGDDDLRSIQTNAEFFGDDGNDRLFGGGGFNLLHGGDGDDQLFGAGAGASNSLFGDAGADQLYGDGAADTLDGGTGNDTLDGRSGGDTMSGGSGNDIYYVDNAADQVIEAAGGGSDNVYASASFALAAGQEVEYLRVYGAAGLALTGNEFSHYLIGGTGNDTLNGGTGSDYLDGGAGADAMSGGTGNDTYYVDNAADQVIEAAGAGSDNVYASANFALEAGQEVEFLRVYGSAARTLTGNELANYLIGGAGGDTLNAGAGADYLDGGAGADTMAGGIGNDTYYVNNVADQVIEAAGGGSDNVYASANFTLGAGQEVESLRVYGSAGLALTGNEFANYLVGAAGDDTLNAGLGDDTLRGGDGRDAFVFSTAIAGQANVDVISDFTTSFDSILLDHTVFAGLPVGQLDYAHFSVGSASGVDPQIVFNSATGALSYDDNGALSGGALQFATLAGSSNLGASDFWIV